MSGPGSPAETHAGSSDRLAPWLRILRAPRLATDARKLILATLGLVASAIGWQGLDALFAGAGRFRPPGLPTAPPGATAEAVFAQLTHLADPFRVVVEPAVGVLDLGNGPWAFLHAALALAWASIVWSLTGGAIARVAMVQQAGGEGVGLVHAFRFAARKAVPLVVAPLSPWVGVAILAAPCALMGLLYRTVGDVGATTAGILAFVPLLAGLVMGLILIGLAAGWPLMVAAVAAEGEDGFDALSRSYSYVFQRPGRYLASAALAALGGGIGWLAVQAFAALVLQLAAWALAFGAPDDRVAGLFAGDPAVAGATAAGIHRFWRSVVGLVAYSWIYSFFWSAASMIYLSLRREVDGTPSVEVYLEPRAAVPDADPAVSDA